MAAIPLDFRQGTLHRSLHVARSPHIRLHSVSNKQWNLDAICNPDGSKQSTLVDLSRPINPLAKFYGAISSGITRPSKKGIGKQKFQTLHIASNELCSSLKEDSFLVLAV